MNKQLFAIFIFVAFGLHDSFAQVIVNIKDINPAGGSYPFGFTVSNNKLFFIASDNVNFRKLWVTEGTATTTTLLGPATGAVNSITNPVAYNGKVYFSQADNTSGQELWVSDGTPAGTVFFKDLYPGSTGAFPNAFTVANNKLIFVAAGVNGSRRLYASDGTAAGTIIIRDNFVNLFNGLATLAVMNNEVYFGGDNGTGSGNGLWKSDGTAAGTVLVKANIIPGVTSSYVVLNNKIYFCASENASGNELWVSDGTTAGTQLVKNISITGSGNPQGLVQYNNKIYFAASDETNGMELFVSDGTEAGTQLVKDIIPGTTGSLPYQLNVYNGLLYIVCWGPQQLWKSDGTPAGTQFVKAVSPFLRFAANWNDRMYLITGSNSELWQSDGSAAGTGLLNVENSIYSVNTDTGFGSDLVFTEYNGGLYLSANCLQITTSFEPCKLIPVPPPPTYSFTGNGNWSNPSNWAGNMVPPATLLSGTSILISGQCILDVAQFLQTGSSFTVATGAQFTILGSLILQ